MSGAKGFRKRAGVKSFAVSLRLILALTAIGLASFAFSSDFTNRVSVTCVPIFLGSDISHGARVEIDNSGPSAHGVFTLKADGGTISYPIELPQGVKKAFDAYPLINSSYAQVQCDLVTDQGSTHFEVPFGVVTSLARVLEITDSAGGLQFLKTDRRQGTGSPRACEPLYVKPDEAPSRLLAYRNLAAIVLGPGAERLSDEAVQAITLYVQSGGRLVFSGGSSAPSVMDRRWNSLLPLSHPRPTSGMIDVKSVPFALPGSDVMRSDGAPEFHEAGALVTGDLNPGAHQGRNQTVSTPYGMGRVTVISFDLFEGPIHAWPGLANFMQAQAYAATGGAIFGLDEPQDDQASPYAIGGGGVVVSPKAYGRGPFSPAMNSSPDPFSFQPPRPETMAWIIVAYLLLVAPVNFLVLRRFRKTEWAWFTTPAISVVFAVILLQSASELYGGGLSTMSIGNLLVTEDSGKAIYRGASQLFFPQGGLYDLKLSDVDWIVSTNQRFAMSSIMEESDDLEAVDESDLQVPAYAVRNLQFKSLEFEQTVDSAGWFSMAVKRAGDTVHLTVTNHSPFSMRNGFVSAEGGQAPILRLDSGQSATIDVPVVQASSQKAFTSPATQYSSHIHRAILQGTLDGFRPGPQVGKEVSDRSTVSLVMVGDKPTGAG